MEQFVNTYPFDLDEELFNVYFNPNDSEWVFIVQYLAEQGDVNNFKTVYKYKNYISNDTKLCIDTNIMTNLNYDIINYMIDNYIILYFVERHDFSILSYLLYNHKFFIFKYILSSVLSRGDIFLFAIYYFKYNMYKDKDIIEFFHNSQLSNNDYDFYTNVFAESPIECLKNIFTERELNFVINFNTERIDFWEWYLPKIPKYLYKSKITTILLKYLTNTYLYIQPIIYLLNSLDTSPDEYNIYLELINIRNNSVDKLFRISSLINKIITNINIIDIIIDCIVKNYIPFRDNQYILYRLPKKLIIKLILGQKLIHVLRAAINVQLFSESELKEILYAL